MTSSKLTTYILSVTLVALSGCALSPKNVSDIQFKDPNFAHCIAQTKMAVLSDIAELNCSDRQITHVDEIRYMPALTDLNLMNNELAEFDTTLRPNLQRLNLQGNKLSNINLSNSPELTFLNISNNKISNIDVGQNSKLISLYAYKLPLTQIDVSAQSKLRDLGLSKHKLTNIDLSNNPQLQSLNLSVGTLDNIDLTHNAKLSHVYLASNQLTQIDVSQNPKLIQLSVRNNQLNELDLSRNAQLVTLKADYNKIEDVLFSAEPLITELEINNNRLTVLDTSAFAHLDKLTAFNNPLQLLKVNHAQPPKVLSIEGTPYALSNQEQTNERTISNLLSPRVSILEAGLISQDGNQYNIFSSQLVLPSLGQYIGYRYSVTLPKNVKGKIAPELVNQAQFPITVRMTHPEIVDPKSGKGFTTSSWTDTMLKHDRNLAMWYFGDKHELVSGRWTLDILYRNSVIATKSFMLVNMDEEPKQKPLKNVTFADLISNGQHYLCTDKKYRSCLGFSDSSHCETSLQPFKAQCQQSAIKAVQKLRRRPMNTQLKAFFSHLTACMGDKYIQTSKLVPQQVGSCLSN